MDLVQIYYKKIDLVISLPCLKSLMTSCGSLAEDQTCVTVSQALHAFLCGLSPSNSALQSLCSFCTPTATTPPPSSSSFSFIFPWACRCFVYLFSCLDHLIVPSPLLFPSSHLHAVNGLPHPSVLRLQITFSWRYCLTPLSPTTLNQVPRLIFHHSFSFYYNYIFYDYLINACSPQTLSLLLSIAIPVTSTVPGM